MSNGKKYRTDTTKVVKIKKEVIDPETKETSIITEEVVVTKKKTAPPIRLTNPHVLKFLSLSHSEKLRNINKVRKEVKK